MFSVFKCKMHTRSLRRFFESDLDEGFRVWYHLMHQRCQPERTQYMVDFQKPK